jgi:hypothetical protein
MKSRQNRFAITIEKALILGTFSFASVASAQNVGIGFSNPASKLTVNGNFAVGADYNAAAPANGAIIEGNVGINTVTPRWKLEVDGPVAVVGGSYPTTENGFALGWNIVQPGFGVAELVNYSGTGGGNAFDFFLVPNSGAPSTANVIASINHAGVYTASDQRLKTGIQPLHYGLREVMDLQPKEYDLHLGKSFKDGVLTLEPKADHQIGFLAQDVYHLVLEAVQKPKDPGNAIYKMNYSILVPVLVSAVQELKHLQDATVAEQQAKITQQETKIASLEAEVVSLRQTNEKLAALASKLDVLEKAVDSIQVKESRKEQTFAINGNN